MEHALNGYYWLSSTISQATFDLIHKSICFCNYLVHLSVKEEAKKEKIVTTVKKGSAVMDKCLPDDIKARYHVLQVVSHFESVFSKQRKRHK